MPFLCDQIGFICLDMGFRVEKGTYCEVVTDQAIRAAHFLDLHYGDAPLLLPNPWNPGSAKLFASIGFDALATTSSGHAATLGRLDGGVSREEALSHAGVIVDATPLPVSADLERGFADDPAGVAETVSLAIDEGLAGCSVEDFTGRDNKPIYDAGLAKDRVAAAAETAHAGSVHLVLTARAENYLHNRPDLADTITRLQSFQENGADVLYAPGLTDVDDIRAVVKSVDLPVNVLALPGAPTVSELAEIGVKRISVGGGFSLVGLAAVAEAADEFLNEGTYRFWSTAVAGAEARNTAFS